jgi:hypothetical protein
MLEYLLTDAVLVTSISTRYQVNYWLVDNVFYHDFSGAPCK